MSVQTAKSTWSPWRWGLFLAFLVLAYAWAKVMSLEEHIYLAPFLSIATLVTAFAVWASRDAGGEKEAIDRARQGLLPRDGEKGAAIGTIHPLTDDVPEAPFSGRKAVAYIYRVYRRERTSSTSKGGSIEYDVAAYVGRAAALSEVRTAAGPVRVLGMPLLEVEKEVLSGWEALGRARDYLSRTPFQEKEHGIGQGGTEVVLSTRAFDPGASGLREDFRYTEISDLTDWILEETVVPPGQEVSAFGWYSEKLGALTCSPEGSAESESTGDLLLRPGGIEAASQAQRRHAGCAKFLGILALVFQLVTVAALSGREGCRERRRIAALTFPQAAESGDLRLVEQLIRKKKVDFFARGDNGRTAAHLARDAATLELVLRAAPLAEVPDAYGDTPLMWHASKNDPASVRLLVNAGVDPEARDVNGRTAIQHTENEEVRKILLDAGATDPDGAIPGGESLPPGGGDPWKVVQATLDAARRGDTDAVNSRWRLTSGDACTEADLKDRFWWPEAATFLAGEVLAGKARVESRAENGGQAAHRLIWHLAREEDVWRITGVLARP